MYLTSILLAEMVIVFVENALVIVNSKNFTKSRIGGKRFHKVKLNNGQKINALNSKKRKQFKLPKVKNKA